MESSHQLLRKVFKKEGAKCWAQRFKLSLTVIHKWCRPGAEGGSALRNPLDAVELIVQAANDSRVVQWICAKAGGFFVRNPAPKTGRPATGRSREARVQALLAAHSQAEEQLAQFKLDVARAVQDGQVTAAEAAQLRSDWEVVKSELESFVVACERGSFRCVAIFSPLLPWLAEAELALA